MRKPCLPRSRPGELFSLPARTPELPAEVRQKMVRLLQLSEFLNVRRLHPAVLCLPAVVSLLADAVLMA
jgi:hypothetical protein